MNHLDDRRSRRTKTSLKESLFELLKTHELSHISVSMLTEHANIGRSTFYVHYVDIYELLNDMEQDVLQTYLSNFENLGVKKAFDEICHFTKENQNFVLAFQSTYAESITKKFLSSKITDYYPSPPPIAPYILDYAIAGSNHILLDWLKDRCQTDVSEIASALTTLTLHVLLLLES